MLPKTAEYGLRAVVWLASEGEGARSADQIAAVTRIPRRYLHKVLQGLVRTGILHSQSGPHGGYSLGKPAESITLLHVVNALGAVERIRTCPLELKTHTSLCPLHREVDNAYAAIEEAFARVTVAQVVGRHEATPPLCDVK